MTLITPTDKPTGALIGSARTALRPPPRPGIAEKWFVFIAMCTYAMNLPTDWFVVSTLEETAGNESTGPLASIVFLAFAGIAFLIVLPRFEVIIHIARRAVFLGLLACWLVLTTVWSADPPTTLRRSFGVFLTVFFAFYLVARFERPELLRLAAYASAATVWINLAFVFGLPSFAVNPQTGILDGTTWNRNSLGQLVVLCALQLVLYAAMKPTSRIWIVPTIGAALFLLLGTESKTSLASAVLLSGLLVIFQLFRARKTLFGAVAFSMGGASVIAIMFATANLPAITDILDRDITLSGRTKLWDELLPVIGHHPILGQGYSAFWRGWFSPAHDIWLADNWFPPSAHNATLDYLLELGIIGLGLVLAYFFTAVVWATYDIRDNPGAAGTWPLAMLAYQLMFSVTESGVIARNFAFLLLSVLVASVSISRAETLGRTAARHRDAEREQAAVTKSGDPTT